MNNYVIVGDIHGRKEIVEKVLEKFPDEHKVFVGDFLDSYDRSSEDCIEALVTAMWADNTTILMGNHELSYVLPDTHRCSGYSKKTQTMFNHIKDEYLDKVRLYLELDVDDEGMWLVTHAGLTGPSISRQAEEHLSYISNKGFSPQNPAFNIGWYRGGLQATHGGILWCDFYAEHDGVPGVTQIVGHTARRERKDPPGIFYHEGKNTWNIDCQDRAPEVLIVYENGTTQIVNLDDT